MAAIADLRARLAAAGQEHVLAHWEELSPEERIALEQQIADIDSRLGVANLKSVLEAALAAEEGHVSCAIEPPVPSWLGKADGSDPESELRWEAMGLKLIAEGACAACVLAGGMGTRLGTAFPKGLLGDKEVGIDFLPSGKSLFQLYAERILAIQRRAEEHHPSEKRAVVWFLVMTSEQTHHTITDFFERRNFFGLQRSQVLFFPQGTMPCFAPDGRVLMETKGRIAASPDGNFGIYPALARSGVLDKLQSEGVRWLQVFSVDNVLVRVGDPVWYGYCEETNADVVSKTVTKRTWQESVGLFTLRGGVPWVIEYTEIGETRAQETDAAGQLRYNAANICLQAYSIDFLAGPVQAFPPVWHVAHKDIQTIDGKVPGIKIEAFICEPFVVAKTFRMLQVDRAAEFSAIKNASGSGKPDTPQTALAALSRLHRQWLRNAGAKIPEDDAEGHGPVCEISPLVSYRGEGLEAIAKELDTSSGSILLQ